MSLRFIKRRQRYRLFLAGAGMLSFLLVLFLLGSCMRRCLLVEKTPVIENELRMIKLWDEAAGELVEIGLEAYVLGVVAAEMPASFAEEALKAQAVAARTYALKRLLVPDPRVKAVHQAAELSSDPAVNQAWISTAVMKKRWGKWNYLRYYKKVAAAVQETQAEVLLYNGQLIDPVYHASCGGRQTENAEAVWQFAFPYLKGVPCTGHQDKHQLTKISFTHREARELLGLAKLDKITPGQKSSTGRVETIVLNGKSFSGAEMRTIFNLPSTKFTCQLDAQGLNFSCNGYGHGVGMCQYGAQDLAKAGKNYREILKHYYRGVEIGIIEGAGF